MIDPSNLNTGPMPISDKMREALCDAAMQPTLDEIVKATIAHGVEDAPNPKNGMRHKRIASMVRALFAERWQAAQSGQSMPTANRSEDERFDLLGEIAELERLRMDAERYRWLRDDAFEHSDACFMAAGRLFAEKHGVAFDEAIDAAMQERKS